MTLTSTDISSLKIFQNGTKGRKARQILVVWESISLLMRMIVMYIHMGAPKSFQLYMGMYIVLSSSTKSMTLTSIDIGSLKIFQNGTEGRKACLIW